MTKPRNPFTKTTESKEQHYYLDSTAIWYPQDGGVYHIKSKDFTNEITVTLTGDFFEKCMVFDVVNNICRFKILMPHMLDMTDIMPLKLTDPKTGATLGIYKESKAEFASLISASFDIAMISTDSYTFKYSYTYNNWVPVRSSNLEIKDQCERELKDIPVHAGGLPFFIDKKPTSTFLFDLYRQFRKYNNHQKLSEQFKNSNGHCHVRAHFVKSFLNCFGVPSLTINKFYNLEDWKKLPSLDHDPWGFHCATLIIDNDNKEWVWDPWVGYSKHLLTLKQWVYRKDEPKPTKMSIASSEVVFDEVRNKYALGLNFMTMASPVYIKAVQAVACSALPNRPQYSLSLGATLFFKQFEQFKQDLKKEQETIAANSIKKSRIMFTKR